MKVTQLFPEGFTVHKVCRADIEWTVRQNQDHGEHHASFIVCCLTILPEKSQCAMKMYQISINWSKQDY